MVQGRALQENLLGVYKFETHSAGSVAPHVSSKGPQAHVKRLGLSIFYNHYKIKAPALRNVLNGKYLILHKPFWEAWASRFCNLVYGADVCAPLAVARHLDFVNGFNKVEGGGLDLVGPHHPEQLSKGLYVSAKARSLFTSATVWLGSVLPSPKQKWQRPVPCQGPVGKACSKYGLPRGSGAAATQGARQLSDMATFHHQPNRRTHWAPAGLAQGWQVQLRHCRGGVPQRAR